MIESIIAARARAVMPDPTGSGRESAGALMHGQKSGQASKTVIFACGRTDLEENWVWGIVEGRI